MDYDVYLYGLKVTPTPVSKTEAQRILNEHRWFEDVMARELQEVVGEAVKREERELFKEGAMAGNLYTADARYGAEQSAKEQTSAASSEPVYAVNLPASTIRRMAKLSPEADRKLRAQVPQVFSIDVRFEQARYPMGRIRVAGVDGPPIDVITMGPQAGRGIYLPGDYIWEIVPYRGPAVSPPNAKALVARRIF